MAPIRKCSISTALSIIVATIALATLPSTAAGHDPGTDGGPADRGCKPVINARYYVGASGRVSCRIARIVARGSIRGQSFERWRCTGVGAGFGHCHGRGIRRGSIVHWSVND
jgi:hypothetical protein